MKKIILLILILVLGSLAFALPPSYTGADDHGKGWFEVVLTYHFFAGRDDPFFSIKCLMFGETLTWIDNDNLGFGFSLGMGNMMFLFTIDTAYYIDPFDSQSILFPIYCRIGAFTFEDRILFASLMGGIELFAGHWKNVYEYDPDEELCVNLAALGGINLSTLSLLPDDDMWGFEFIPGFEISGGISSANGYSPSSGVYYY